MGKDQAVCDAIQRDISRLFTERRLPATERQQLRDRALAHARPVVKGRLVIQCFDCWKEFVKQEAVH